MDIVGCSSEPSQPRARGGLSVDSKTLDAEVGSRYVQWDEQLFCDSKTVLFCSWSPVVCVHAWIDLHARERTMMHPIRALQPPGNNNRLRLLRLSPCLCNTDGRRWPGGARAPSLGRGSCSPLCCLLACLLRSCGRLACSCCLDRARPPGATLNFTKAVARQSVLQIMGYVCQSTRPVPAGNAATRWVVSGRCQVSSYHRCYIHPKWHAPVRGCELEWGRT